MADDAQDRRLPASARKIEKARGEGQVARSRDLGHLAAFGVGGALLVMLAPTGIEWLRQTLISGLVFGAHDVTETATMSAHLSALVQRMLAVVLPVGLLMALVALAAGVLSGGWNFTLKAVQPKFSKLDPLAGIKRMVSLGQLGDLLKTCGLALVLGTVGALYLRARIDAFPQLLALPLPAALAGAGELVLGGLALLLGVLAAFALVDVPLQRHKLLKQLRMTHEEVKKESRDAEGNPEIKAKVRQRMRALANRRMLAAVPGADIVVMNPTHFAVALKYDEAAMGAPRVVAKGSDLMALRIRDAARAAQVPVLQAPPLARALHAHCEVDQEVPAVLFAVVAQVLAWVYQLRTAMANGSALPADLPPLAVPPGLDPAAPDAKRRGGRA